jgi:zinc D-Ala-D-Ala carboxypeptidase
MGDLTKNISKSELECKCGLGCGFISCNYETVVAVQEACDHFANKLGLDKVSLTVLSVSRCPRHNNQPVRLGGAGSNNASQHIRGTAMDHRIAGVSNDELYAYYDAKYPLKYGLGVYSWGVHLDTREAKARW